MDEKFGFYPAVKAAWIEGYRMGHKDGNDCGQSYSLRCHHDAEREWLDSEVFERIRRDAEEWVFGEQHGKTCPDTSDPTGT